LVAVICLIRPERLDRLLEEAVAVVERHIGLVPVTDAGVLRVERFLARPRRGLDGAPSARQDRRRRSHHDRTQRL
jgi:hypothetical protein